MKKFLVLITLTASFWGFTIQALATHQEIIACSTSTEDVSLAVQNASQAIYMLEYQFKDYNDKYQKGKGSGFFINSRHLVTSFSVVDTLYQLDALNITLSQNGQPIDIKVNKIVFASATMDIVILETDKDAPFYLSLQKESTLSENEKLFVLGYSQGNACFIKKAGPFKPSLLGWMGFSVKLQDMRGVSGGPVVDSKGYVSGVYHTTFGNFVSSTKSDKLKQVLLGKQAVSCKSITSHSVCLDKAVRHTEEQANKGDILAQYRLGDRYSRKYGILDQAFEKAKFWFTKSAKQGSATAQYMVGGQHIFTLEGLEWMTKSAKQGYAPAQYFLGHIKVLEWPQILKRQSFGWIKPFSKITLVSCKKRSAQFANTQTTC